MNEPVWLIGAGPMAVAYARVLQAQSVPFQAIGRGAAAAAAFEKATGSPCRTGGLASALAEAARPPAAAIVAVGAEALADSTVALIEAGAGRLLVEKPAGLDEVEVGRVAAAADHAKAQVFVAYNRRFYASAKAAQAMIAEDRGVTSLFFEFTEIASSVERSPARPEVKANWFLANSTHVVDLAFFLAGRPTRLDGQAAGELPWHPRAARFAGSGVTENGALFAYLADWEAPGRWGIEVMTRRRRLIFRPMEQLRVQRHGSFEVETVALDDDLDRNFKPGLFLQTEAFLAETPGDALLCIQDHLDMITKHYRAMVGPGTNT